MAHIAMNGARPVECPRCGEGEPLMRLRPVNQSLRGTIGSLKAQPRYRPPA
jgi:hypothetical protein